MSGLDWSILRTNEPVDIAGNFARGYQLATGIIDKMHQRSALGALAENPDDPHAMARLYAVNPELGARLEAMNLKRKDAHREDAARSALAAWMSGPNGIPAPAGLTGVQLRGALSPYAEPAEPSPDRGIFPPLAAPSASAATEQAPETLADNSEAPIIVRAPRTSSAPMSDSWAEFVQNDPEGAMKLLLQRGQIGDAQAKAIHAQMGVISTLTRGVTDQDSYTAALEKGRQLGFDVSHLPAEYDPEVVDRIQRQAQSATEYLTLNHNIADDEADNERADRAQELLEDYREGQLKVARERVAATRRGQDMRSQGRSSPQPKAPTPATVIGRIMDKQASGQALTVAEQQTLTDYRASQHPQRGRRSAAPVQVQTPVEARRLPPGTVFQTPDGRVKIR